MARRVLTVAALSPSPDRCRILGSRLESRVAAGHRGDAPHCPCVSEMRDHAVVGISVRVREFSGQVVAQLDGPADVDQLCAVAAEDPTGIHTCPALTSTTT